MYIILYKFTQSVLQSNTFWELQSLLVQKINPLWLRSSVFSLDDAQSLAKLKLKLLCKIVTWSIRNDWSKWSMYKEWRDGLQCFINPTFLLPYLTQAKSSRKVVGCPYGLLHAEISTTNVKSIFIGKFSICSIVHKFFPFRKEKSVSFFQLLYFFPTTFPIFLLLLL